MTCDHKILVHTLDIRKVFEFKVIESIIKDTSDVPDMEEAEEVLEETLNE